MENEENGKIHGTKTGKRRVTKLVKENGGSEKRGREWMSRSGRVKAIEMNCCAGEEKSRVRQEWCQASFLTPRRQLTDKK